MNTVKKMLRSVTSRFPEREFVKGLPNFKMKLLTSHNIDFKIFCGLGHQKRLPLSTVWFDPE